MELLRRSWAIVWKDLLIEARTKQAFNAMVFFAALVLFKSSITFQLKKVHSPLGTGPFLWAMPDLNQ